jgi:hypothetical protein
MTIVPVLFPGHPTRRVAAVALLLLAVPLAGCGGEQTAEVSGKVTINGKPPKTRGLMISFLSSAGKVASAEVAEDGSYAAHGVPVGEVRVGFALVGMSDESSAKAGRPTGDEDPAKVDPKIQFERDKARLRAETEGRAVKAPFPDRFLDPLKSGLTTTVEPGKANTYNPDIK